MKPIVLFVAAVTAGAGVGAAQSYPLLAPWSVLGLTALLALLARMVGWRARLVAVFLFALAYLSGALYWLGLAIYHPPVNSLGSAVALTAVALVLHALIYTLAIAVGLATVSARGWQGSASTACALAASWALAEVVRSSGWWAMPWGLLGYGQLDNPVLRGLYPLVGGHGVAACAWLLAAGVGALAVGWPWQRILPLVTIAAAAKRGGLARWRLVGGAVVVVGAYASQSVDWTQPTGPALAVRLVHTDLPTDEKQADIAQISALRLLGEMAGRPGTDLTVFPELFLLQSAHQLPKAWRSEVMGSAKSAQTALLFGAPGAVLDAASEAPLHQNTLVFIDGAGGAKTYAKEILLPFSEYLPNTAWLRLAYPFLYHYPQADFVAGTGYQPPMSVRGVDLGVTICSELAYAGKASLQARHAQILVNASADSWIPSGAYLRQAHQIARVRAAEAQKPMVRANNVGYSAFIDHRGRVRSSLLGEPGSGVMEVVPRVGVTPYVAFAAWAAQWGRTSASGGDGVQ